MRTTRATEDSIELVRILQSNTHTLVVMDPRELLDFFIHVKRQGGSSDVRIAEHLQEISRQYSNTRHAIKEEWSKSKPTFKNIGAYIPVFSDAKAFAALAREMHRGGHILSTYRVKSFKGKNYIVIKGYAGLRKQLNGTRYLASNPRIVSMAIGKLGIESTIKTGFIVSVVFSLSFHCMDQLLSDTATWHDFVGGVSVDVAAASIGSWAAWAIVSTIVGGTAMLAVGPIMAVVVVGAALTYGLGEAESKMKLGKKFAKWLYEAEARARDHVDAVKREYKQGLTFAEEDPVGFYHRLFGLPYLGSSIP